MNRNTIVSALVIAVVLIGGIYFYTNQRGEETVEGGHEVPALHTAAPMIPAPTPTTTTSTSSTVTTASGTAPLMQSTGKLFANDPGYQQAHEVYPTPAADLQTIMSGFSYTKTEVGNGIVKITLVNQPAGYQGATVTVGPNQKVYFVERFTKDDANDQDRGTRDDYLVAVDAAGNILQ